MKRARRSTKSTCLNTIITYSQCGPVINSRFRFPQQLREEEEEIVKQFKRKSNLKCTDGILYPFQRSPTNRQGCSWDNLEYPFQMPPFRIGQEINVISRQLAEGQLTQSVISHVLVILPFYNDADAHSVLLRTFGMPDARERYLPGADRGTV